MELAGYSVLGPLGAGGTAELFLAERQAHGGSRRRVALKRILPGFAQDPVFRNLFVHEARVAMQLSHRNVVQVYDFVEAGGTTVLVMEYVDGCDLRALLKLGPLPLPTALLVAVEVLRGLDYAHRKRAGDGQSLEVVHRDVAPGNILLSREGEVKLADFGLARSREQLHKSHTGVKGTFAFMAPEQAEGGAVDGRADLFAVGAVLYAMLAGRGPFDADGPLATLDKVRKAEFQPLGVEGVDAILGRALQRQPDDRYPTAAAMQEALEALAHEQRLRLDPSELARRVTEAAPLKLRLPGPLSVTVDASGDERPQTKVVERKKRRRPPLWIVLPMAAAVMAVYRWVGPHPKPPVFVVVDKPAPVAVEKPPEKPPEKPLETPAPVELRAEKPADKPRSRPKPGYLTVSADPWAYVFIDGRRRGTTPLTDLELPPGEHEVTLENPPLGASSTKKVTLSSGEHRTIIERLSGEH
jgi:serine/threonine-protein kinase